MNPRPQLNTFFVSAPYYLSKEALLINGELLKSHPVHFIMFTRFLFVRSMRIGLFGLKNSFVKEFKTA
ncbi:MAG: hypothetical protein M3270_06040 [Thermoproteota archaeon]|nr:hypothetical protein [Thermoproteota archaeon]